MKTTKALVIILLLLSLCGCSQSAPAAPAPTSQPVAEAVQTPEPTAKITPTPEPEPDTPDYPAPHSMIETPNSTCFSEIGYNESLELLYVRFRDSGSLYYYSGVPVSLWDKFLDSESLGRFYNQYIKPEYDYVLVEKPD